MSRSITWGIGLVAILAGCDLGSLVPGTIEPPCQGHVEPTDCQAALDAAEGDLGADPELYEIRVEPISCDGTSCTTTVLSMPRDATACLPLGNVELARDRAGGDWTVVGLSHGDPPCAFEP